MVRKEDPKQIGVLRFIKHLFGLVLSPFILEGIIEEHLSSYTEKYPTEADQISDDLYVDRLITSGENFEQVAYLKDIGI